MLKSCPELIPHALKGRWKAAVSAPWQVQTAFEITDREIRAAFEDLVKHCELSKSHCFCIFIDGLDEFQETPDYDHKDIVDLFCQWTSEKKGSFKLCVSSREYNAFMNAFSPALRIRLQDLTKRDMANYIRDKLGHYGDQSALDEITTALTNKAQGIFLWLALVVKSIRESMENGSNPTTLMEELDTLPDELESLFEHILNTLTKTSRKRAFQIFAMISQARKYDLPLPLVAYSFLEDYTQSPGFAMKANFKSSHEANKTKEERLRIATRRVNGWCKGLIEPDKSQGLVGPDYAHRSIAEFLRSPRITQDMPSTEDFNSAEAISQLLLADVQVMKHDPEWLSFLVLRLVIMRHDCLLDQPPYTFLEHLGHVIDAQSVPQPHPSLPSKWSIGTHSGICDGYSHLTIVYVLPSFSAAGQVVSLNTVSVTTRYIVDPLYILTCVGLQEYATWKIQHDPAIVDTMQKTLLLATCSMRQQKKKAPVLELLLSSSLLLPDTISNVCPLHSFKKLHIVKGNAEITFWQHWLLQITLMNWHLLTSRVFDGGEAMELLLQHKPDLVFNLSTRPLEPEGWIAEVTLGRQRLELQIFFEGLGPGLELLDTYTNLSLRGIIDLFDCDNKKRLLEMVDSQERDEQAKKEAKVVQKGIRITVDTKSDSATVISEQLDGLPTTSYYAQPGIYLCIGVLGEYKLP